MSECLIVIASFADGYLDNLLTSIEENTTDVDYEIQVVDNHKDEKLLKECVIPVCEKHGVQLYLNTKITGYGDALNTGVEVSDSESKYILYMDSDTLVTDGWLREMIECYKWHKEDGCRMVGPLVKDFEDRYLPGVKQLYGNPEDLVGKDIQLVGESSYLIGVCILRERSTLNEFKWDKNFVRAYWEDNDLSEQVRFWNYKMWVAGKSLMMHKVNSSHETIIKEGFNPSAVGARNKHYFEAKWDKIYSLNKDDDIIGHTLGTSFIIKG